MATKYMQMNADAYQHLSINAGLLCRSFDPATGTVSGIMGATTGGVTFNSNPTYEDWAEDIDQADNNMMEFKRITSYDPTMSGTFLEVTPDLIRELNAAADIDATDATHIIPRGTLTIADFNDVWWVGDYSDVNTGNDAGFLAIHLKRALNQAGFQITSSKNAKNQFSFEFHGHYSLSAQGEVPFEIWCQSAASEAAALESLSITGVTLTPTFDAEVTSYTATTNAETNVITATAAHEEATVVIKNGTTPVTSGSAATWVTGANTVTVTVVNGASSKVYTVTVTKSE